METRGTIGQIHIRPARLEDASQLAALCTQLGYPCTVPQVQQRIERMLPGGNQAMLVAEAEAGFLVGWIQAFGLKLLVEEPLVMLGGLVVDAAHRGQGIGRRLLRQVEQWARQEGYGTIAVHSNIVRERAHKFYQDLGYEIVKTQHIFRKRLDAI